MELTLASFALSMLLQTTHGSKPDGKSMEVQLITCDSIDAIRKCKFHGHLAQRLAQGTHNPLVVGSNPTVPTF